MYIVLEISIYLIMNKSVEFTVNKYLGREFKKIIPIHNLGKDKLKVDYIIMHSRSATSMIKT